MKILLVKYKNLKQQYYVRKLSNNFLNYVFLAKVNKNNQLTHINTEPTFLIQNSDKIRDKYQIISQYTLKMFNKTFDDDTLCCHALFPSFKVPEPLTLTKKVRGVRYATNEEMKWIINEIIQFCLNYEKLSFHDIIYNTPKYQNIYSKCIEYDIIGDLFEYEEKGGIKNEF